jgi:hypothetical protein
MGCSSDKSTDSNTDVRVSGELLAYVCGDFGEPERYPYSDTLPYTVKTGRLADLRFTDEVGTTTAVQTDDLSAFDLTLPAGLYTITVETDHTRPDTFDSVSLTADTIMSLVIRYDYSHTNLIYLAFCYETSGYAPLIPEAERVLLDQLNDSLGGWLLLDNAMRFSASFVLYRIPTSTERRLWEVVEAVAYQLAAASPHPALRMDIPGFGLCPDDFNMYDDSTIFGPLDSLWNYDPPDPDIDTNWYGGDGGP